jgi:translocation and assembly module TamA
MAVIGYYQVVLKLTYFVIFILFPHYALASQKLCPTVIVHGENIKFTDMEVRLVCGDDELEAYENIPAYEASFMMTGFLQSRGYLKPAYETVDGVLHVYTGKESHIKKIEVQSSDEKLRHEVKTELRRLYKKRSLSTSVLNSIEADAKDLARQRGFPCTQIKSEVDITESKVFVYLDHGLYSTFGKVDREVIPGLRKNALNRYYPFDENQKFNESLLVLTEKRIQRSEVVPATYFVERCTDDEFKLSQKFVLGPSKTIRFGVGASTEQGPMVRIRWQNNRYESMASQLSANLQASLRSQSVTLTADSFFWHHEPRRSLFSLAEIVRESQIDYEQLVYRLKPHIKWTRDSEKHHKLYTLGPSYEGGTYHSKENSNTKSFSSGILEGSLQWMSNSYELFDIHPQEGNVFGMNFDFRHPSLGFSDPLMKFDTTYVNLNRIGNWGRGTIVSGVRLNAGTTWVSDKVSLTSLPPTVKFFGGGSDDNRGFNLRTLPLNDGLGSLTKLSMKLELRRTYLFKESVEGFTFFDNSYFGGRSWYIDPQLYYSPGIGVRWLSPIGLVQGYAARAFRSSPNKDLGNQFFLGLGGVF